ncbi:MAG TPA: tetratricopeptide repeat protein [Thermoanaerobaculia bacterium]|nr:tetratricopeptide repeat protein [Thermoanaerobaculia bacterium]
MSDPHDPTQPLSHVAPLPSWQFAANDVIADRYRVVSVAGEGGMGVVYEVEDLELDELVALKIINAPDPTRLRREVQLARRVTHPNVCRTYDVGNHGGRTSFVTMELLRGETLGSYLGRKGRLSPDEAKTILEQLCAGLDAAHAAGVIHRDFKSANVMLVPRGAVITDFGLARAHDPDSGASVSGSIVGTPAYMAPEQIERGEVTPATDVYALGIVAFEMLTGTLPFEGGGIPSLVRRLKERAPSPRERVPELDRRWEWVILKCLERDPKHRFQRAGDVVRALHEGRPPRRWGLAAGIALAFLSVIAGTAYLVTRPEEEEAVQTAPVAKRRSAAILGFRNLAQQPQVAWLSTALAEMLGTELAASESVRLVPGEEVARAKQNLGLREIESHTAATLAKLRRTLGADVVVTGSYVVIPGGQLRLDVRLQDTHRGETVAAFQSTGAESDLFALVSNAGTQLRQRLGAEAQLAGGVNLRRAVPVNVDAARAYSEGLARLRVYDVRGAIESFEAATKADPLFALAHSELARANTLLGFDAQAVAHSKRAVELSAALPRAERLLVEARDHQVAGRMEKAVERYQTLVTLFPDDPEHRVRLIDGLIAASRGKDALAAVEAMRRLPGIFESDPRIDLIEAWATEIVSDYRRMLVSADRAIAKARATSNRNVLAEALVMRANALANLSKNEEAIVAFDEADELFVSIGDRNSLARSLRKRSFILWRRGDLAEARRITERALAIYRETGQKLGTANATGIIGVLLSTQGEHTEARKHFEQALTIYREIGDRQNSSWALASIGGTYMMQNEPARARALFEESLAIAREIGDSDQISSCVMSLGRLAYERGDLAAAAAHVTEAKALYEKNADRSSAADADMYHGAIALARGELAVARAAFERSLAEKGTLEERSSVAENQLGLARVALESGDPATALAQASAAAASYDREDDDSDAATAWAVIAEAHLAAGRRDLASEAAAKAMQLAAKGEYAAGRAYIEITAARVARDAKKLRALVERTSREKLRAPHLEARYALAELERDAAALATVERDARSAGFGAIAHRASAERRRLAG